LIAPYYDGSDVITADNGSSDYIRISASSIEDFFSNTRYWFGQTLLGEEGFDYSTATILGTIIHHFAEMEFSNIEIEDPEADVEGYLSKYINGDNCEKSVIRELWQPMLEVMLSSIDRNKQIHSVEQFIYHKILNGIYVGGTYDRLSVSTVGSDPSKNTYTLGDYKTSSTKPNGINKKYKMQLMTYAWILKQKGIIVDSIELHYVVRPTKTLPARYFHFKEMIYDEDFDVIEGQIKLIAETIELWNKHPELRYILCKDYRVKALYKPKPKLFKKD
jgi:hypothetical protein